MASSPLVSVILPVYNHQKFVREALESVYQQNYPRVELIVIDDGSQDRSPEIVEDHLRSSPYPYQWIRQDNRGAHAAINTGISTAQGRYLALLNSDDRYHPQRLEDMIPALENSFHSFAFSGVEHIDGAGNPLAENSEHHFYYQQSRRDAVRFPTLTFELIRHNFAVSSGNFIFTRNLYDRVGPFQPYETCHDWDFLLRVILEEEPLFVEDALYQYRVHSQNTLQQQAEVWGREIEEVVSNYLDGVKEASNPYAPGPEAWGSYWYYFVWEYMDHFREYEKLEERLKAWEDDLNLAGWNRLRGFLGKSFQKLRGLLARWEGGLQENPAAMIERRQKWFRRWARVVSLILPRQRPHGDTG